MHGTQRLHFCSAFILLLLVSTALAEAYELKGDNGRQLLQREDGVEIVVSEENARLERAIRNAEAGDTIVIEAEKVNLSELITISVNRLHIRGAARNRPAVIQCTGDEARIDVNSNRVVFENLVIRDCLGPAVRIINENAEAYDPFAEPSEEPENVKTLEISFLRVRFVNNIDRDDSFDFYQSLDGGAIQVTAHTEATVEDCEFERNGAFLGGAIRVDSGSLTVRGSRFVENEAQISGGAISGGFSALDQESTTTFLIENSVFLRNHDVLGGEDASGLTLHNGAPLETSEFLSFPSPQSSGGAIYVQGFREAIIRECIFDGNTANPAAGAIFVADNNDVQLTNNTFRNNVAEFLGPNRNFDLEQGGAIYVAFTKADSSISVSKCIFRNNTASYGGGLHMVMMLVTSANIEESEFIQNTANLGGGGLVLRNTIEVEILDTKFYRNRATSGGGALFTNGAGARFTQGADASRDTIFQENIALDGGACFFLGAGQVSAQKLAFVRNKAERNGGGMCLVESLASGSVGLQQSLFLENTARRGGGLFMDSIASLVLRAPSFTTFTEFFGNKAMAGGAVYLRPSSQVKNVVSASLINCTGNEAVKRLEDIYSAPLNYADVDVARTE